MGDSHTTTVMNLEDKFVFGGKLKTFTFILMAIGVISLVALVFGAMSDNHGENDAHQSKTELSANHESSDPRVAHTESHGSHVAHEVSESTHHDGSTRLWTNLLINSFFFFGIAIAALFFMSIQYAAEAGWSTVLKRIMEAISSYIIPGAIPLAIVFIAASLHWNHIYHWMDPDVMDPTSEHYDRLIAGKKPFLNQYVFWGFSIFFVGLYIFFQRMFRTRSLQEDKEAGTKLHMSNFASAAGFLVIFGYSSVVLSWLWIMSIDTHWFSTLFGWYIFSGIWISCLTAMILIVLYLKRNGHMPYVNSSHIQDLGKWMFAISILWSYLWFSQFMLIWYANIPEEVTYYIPRLFGEYKSLFIGMFLVNFIFPTLLLMDSANKRSPFWLTFVGIFIFLGHWMDAYLLITPAVAKSGFEFGFQEIGLMLGFLGVFMFFVFRSLSKANLVVKNNPYLDESINFHL